MLRVLAVLALLAGCSQAPAPVDPDAAALEVDVHASRDAGVVKGLVVDNLVRPLEGVRIQVEGGGIQTNTTANGAFGLELPPGNYQLLATKPGYATARQSAVVVADVDDPPVVRILLSQVASAEPRFEGVQYNMVARMQFCVEAVGCYTQPGPWDQLSDEARGIPSVEIGPGATVAQGEFVWTPQTDLATHGTVTCGSRTSSLAVDHQATTGPSPVAQRIGLTGSQGQKQVAATSAWCNWHLAQGDLPLAYQHDQYLEAFVHVFYHVMPEPGWRFSRDGDPGVP